MQRRRRHSERRTLTDYEQKAGAPTHLQGGEHLLLERGHVKHERVRKVLEVEATKFI